MEKTTPGGAGTEDDVSGGENVSRSGRVRKKSSLLAGFESLDALEKGKKKPEKRPKGSREPREIDGEGVPLKKKSKKETTPGTITGRKIKTPGFQKTPKKSKKSLNQHQQKLLNSSNSSKSHLDTGHGDLEMDIPPDFETEEEIGGYNSSDADDRVGFGLGFSGTSTSTSISHHHVTPSNTNVHANANSKLKSQAQSTYMMEKSFNKKSTGPGPQTPVGPGGGGGKAKTARKDKGSPRITAYTLWVKEQRPVFEKKYPQFDHSSLSKKLSEVWAIIPPNQKKMWKNKAAKMMRKNANVMENIKNSGPLPTPRGKKPRGRPRVHALDLDEDSNGLENGSMTMTKKQSPKMIRRPNNFLSKSEKKTPSNSNTKSMKASWKSKSNSQGQSAKGKGGQIIKSKGSNSNSNGSIGGIGIGSPTPKSKSKAKTKVSPGAGEREKPAFRNNLFSPMASTSTSYSLANSKHISGRRDDDNGSLYKVTGTAPMDVAAHFALLGESLSIIGERLKDVEGQTVSGSLSVLLDSLLCATGPLLCLSQQVPEMNCIPQEKLNHLLDNIAYVMPGL